MSGARKYIQQIQKKQLDGNFRADKILQQLLKKYVDNANKTFITTQVFSAFGRSGYAYATPVEKILDLQKDSSSSIELKATTTRKINLSVSSLMLSLNETFKTTEALSKDNLGDRLCAFMTLFPALDTFQHPTLKPLPWLEQFELQQEEKLKIQQLCTAMQETPTPPETKQDRYSSAVAFFEKDQPAQAFQAAIEGFPDIAKNEHQSSGITQQLMNYVLQLKKPDLTNYAKWTEIRCACLDAINVYFDLFSETQKQQVQAFVLEQCKTALSALEPVLITEKNDMDAKLLPQLAALFKNHFPVFTGIKELAIAVTEKDKSILATAWAYQFLINATHYDFRIMLLTHIAEKLKFIAKELKTNLIGRDHLTRAKNIYLECFATVLLQHQSVAKFTEKPTLKDTTENSSQSKPENPIALR